MQSSSRTIIILSVSSDIGGFLAQKYLDQGHTVIGTYRSREHLSKFLEHPRCHLFALDIHDHQALKSFAAQVKALGKPWDAFISCVGHPLPMTPFFATDIDEWQASFEVNALDQLRAVHALYPHRRSGSMADVVFFAGGGTNNAVVNFSAYTGAKIVLTKMCEFLDAENPDLNIFIVGPGWTKTKVHERIMADPKVSREKLEETRKFMEEGKGTPLEDIFGCIEWLRAQGKAVAGGRNFSIVHDPWKPAGASGLAQQLKADSSMYKLRRHKND